MLQISAALLLAGLILFVRFAAPPVEIVPHATAAEVAVLAERLNIRNLVSAIYLGPRIVDTFLEVMVVILAVVGMKYAREPRP